MGVDLSISIDHVGNFEAGFSANHISTYRDSRSSSSDTIDSLAQEAFHKKAWHEVKSVFKWFNKKVITQIEIYGGALNTVARAARAVDHLLRPVFSFSKLISKVIDVTKVGGVLQVPGVIIGIGFSIFRIASANTGAERLYAFLDLISGGGDLADVVTKIISGLQNFLHISATASTVLNWTGFAGVVLSALSLISAGKSLYDTCSFEEDFLKGLGNKDPDLESLAYMSPVQFDNAMDAITHKWMKDKKGDWHWIERSKAELKSRLEISHHIPIFERKIRHKDHLNLAINKAKNHKDLKQRQLRQMVLVENLRSDFQRAKWVKALTIVAAAVSIIGVATLMLTPLQPLGWALILAGALLSLSLLVGNKILSNQSISRLKQIASDDDLILTRKKDRENFARALRWKGVNLDVA